MGNPCGPDGPALPKGRPSRHRQSLSISSLPLENLEILNSCERRASVSALNSPARALTEPENNNLSTATFLGHGAHSTRKLPPLSSTRNGSETHKGTELATEDRKPTSFNPFRDLISGHRRVESGSNIMPSPPQVKLAGTPTPSSSPAPPKKLNKYAVAKIAASLFHSPAKLERSMSLSKAAHNASSSPPLKINHGGPSLAVGEVILPGNRPQVSSFLQQPSSSQSTQHRVGEEESATPPLASNEPRMQNIIDITKPVEGEVRAAQPPAATPIEDPPPVVTSELAVISNSQAAEDAAEIKMIVYEGCRDAAVSISSSPRNSCYMTPTDESGMSEASMQLPESIAALLFEEPVEGHKKGHDGGHDLQSRPEKVTEAEVTEAAVWCRISSDDTCNGVSTGRVSISFSEEEQESLPNPIVSKDNDTTTTIRASSSPRLTKNNSLVVGDEFAGSKRTISVVKSTLRKRRRSVSASGIEAMLLTVVRVPESGPVVIRRHDLGPPAEMVSRALEKTAQNEAMEPIHTSAPVLCVTDSEDAVQSTYSKFLDIEIDPGHGYIEIVQRSKAVPHGGFDDAGWQRNRRASTRRRPLVKINTSTVYEEKPRPRKTKTIRRSRMNSYDLDYLTEYLKTTNSCSVRAQGHTTTTDRPAAKLTTEANHNVAMSTPERSQTFVSRLQAPTSGAFSYVDEYRPCSVSVRSNFSFSSSHQDKLWEPTESYRYSSGGCGTPDREDEAAAAAAARLVKAANRAAIATRETFVSKLQAPSSVAFSYVDAYNPRSVSVLSNPSFSSSHQDKLWEEPTESYRYSSGGCGTPDREDEAAAAATARLIKAANRAAIAIRKTFVSRLQVPSSVAFSYVDAYNPRSISVLSNPSFSSSHQDQLWEEQPEIYSRHGSPGREDDDEEFPAARNLTFSPPQNLFFNLHHPPSRTFGRSNSARNHSLRRSGFMRSSSASSESGHFMQHFMSRIRGGSLKAAGDGASGNGNHRSQFDMSRRRNSLGSCICFSVKF